jgi:hypothetical protein
LVVRLLFEFDFGPNPDSYDFDITFSGLREELSLRENTIEEPAWCGDSPETIAATYPATPDMAGNVRVVDAGTTFGATTNCFLDLRLPAGEVLAILGESPAGADQIAVGTSANEGGIGVDSALLECSDSWTALVSPVPAHRGRGMQLHANVPNPFNPRTMIAFEIPRQAAVSLHVFDVKGRLVGAVIDGEIFERGRHETEWRGLDGDGRPCASGTYFYRLEAGGYSETKRMLLVK